MSESPTTPALTGEEQAALDSVKARKSARAPLVGVKVTGAEGGVTQIQVNHRDAATAEALFCNQFGTDSSEFATMMAEQLGQLAVVTDSAGNQRVSEAVVNTHIAMVRGVAPTDEVEAMLAAQMSAIHMLTMATAGTAHRAGNQPERRERALAQINKLTRTFTAQMEALKRYRSKGDQKVTVEHVHVHEGGQAIVGNVSRGKAA
jgi:hypothetical protein